MSSVRQSSQLPLASLPMPARIRIKKIHEVIATIIWPMPPSEVRTMFHRIAPCQRICERSTRR